MSAWTAERAAWCALLWCACTPVPDAGQPQPDAGPAAADAGATPRVCSGVGMGITLGTRGSTMDAVTTPHRALVLMGGGAEDDDTARDFVERANGGDVLVLRATGSVETYTPYFYADLTPQPAPNSVTTLLLPDSAASLDEGVWCRVDTAEALWLAGGDQWDYLGVWDAALRQHFLARRAVVGGTSAGAMALGAYAFTAQHGSVPSDQALMDPVAALVAVARSGLAQPELADTVVDTHFTQRGREGRLLVFTAHLLQDGVTTAWGVGLDEDTALDIVDGTATVRGPGDVYLYRVTGPVTAWTAATPLGLEGITRTRLATGTSIPWPPQTLAGDTLHVRNGVVGP